MFKRRLRRIESILRNAGSDQPELPPRQLQTVQDVVDLLQEQVEVVRTARWVDPIAKARAIAYLAGVARKAIEAGVLAPRIEILETILHQRKEQNRS